MAEDMDRFGALPPELRNVIYEMLVRIVPENDHIELRIVEGVVRSSCLRKGPKPRDPSVNRPKKRFRKKTKKTTRRTTGKATRNSISGPAVGIKDNQKRSIAIVL